ncbi:MAG: glycosyltransferase [Cellulosilyticaceae bacterium]
MKIAFFTPLTPLKSGVADFAEELLLGLKQYTDLEIDLFIGDYVPTNIGIKNNFKIKKFKDFENEEIRNQYDEVVYQIGNNEECHEEIYNMALKYPGIVELHDVALHHLIASTTIGRGNIDAYKRIMKYCHGEGALRVVDKFLNHEILPPWETDALTFTVNKEIVDAAKGIIVHSDFAKQMIKGIRPDVSVQLIYLHTPDIYEDYDEQKQISRKELNIPENEFMISTFGFATKTKRILETMEALAEVKKQGYSFKYYIAGAVDGNLPVEKMAKELGIEDNVVITGFLKLEHMKKLMLATDVCMALRYPSQGESSGVLHRMFGMGKLIMVTDINNFSEYPNDVLIKINVENEIEDIKKLLNNIFKNNIDKCKFEKNAFEFSISNCKLITNTYIYKCYIYDKVDIDEYNIQSLIIKKLDELKIQDINVIKSILKNY